MSEPQSIDANDLVNALLEEIAQKEKQNVMLRIQLARFMQEPEPEAPGEKKVRG